MPRNKNGSLTNFNYFSATNKRYNLSKNAPLIAGIHYNHIGMDGGKFKFDSGKIAKMLVSRLSKGIINIGLVPYVSGARSLYFDIDSQNPNPRFGIKDLVLFIIEIAEQIYSIDITDKIIVTKRTNGYKFHIYCTDIVLENKHIQKAIFKAINNHFQYKWIDISLARDGSGLRYDGFNKYSRKTGFEPNSSYKPYKWNSNVPDIKLDKDFFRLTKLSRDEKDITVSPHGDILKYLRSMMADNFNQVDDPEHKSNFSDTSSEISTNGLNIASLARSCDIVQETTVNKFVDQHPEYAQHFVNPTIKRIRCTDTYITFDCSKSVGDRTCPLTGVVHKSNNKYLYWSKSLEILTARCWNEDCRVKWPNGRYYANF